MTRASTTSSASSDGFRSDEAFALEQDERDPLRGFRTKFEIPPTEGGRESVYFCGNSLGLLPTAARALVADELDDWARFAVEAHFRGRTPWYSYHEVFRDSGARLVGARPGEVVMMNSLTVNLHLMMVSFFRPEGARRKILMEAPAFPSDTYAFQSHLVTRGLDPDADLIVVRPRDGEETLRTADIEDAIDEHADTLALVLLGGVNFFTGQLLDLERITARAHARGAVSGFDLAHAAGNVPLALHDWNVDFACWCSYKYLNAGPGAIAGCFVHERHAANTALPRYAGWWGNDPSTRFRMHQNETFVAKADADGWQLSNPPILAMAPLRASLALFDEAGMPALRTKSLALTGYLRRLLESTDEPAWFDIITPADDAAHGCQLSLRVATRARERFTALEQAGIVADFREPDVIRIAPVPLYNSFHDAWRFADVIARGGA